MANQGAWTNTPTGNGKVTIPAGYHNGSGYVDTSELYNYAFELGATSYVKYGGGENEDPANGIDLGFEPKIIILRWCTNDWNTNLQFRVWVSEELVDDYGVSMMYITGESNTNVIASNTAQSNISVSGTKFTFTGGPRLLYFNYLAIG